MKSKVFILSTIAVALVTTSVVVWQRAAGARDNAEFKEQLRLARSEGLPTNMADFLLTIHPIASIDNAAPLYRTVHPMLPNAVDVDFADLALLNHPSAKNLTAARRILSASKAALEIIDQATSKTHCLFDRDWSDGPLAPTPEFTDMRTAAYLLSLRGSTAAFEGRESDAVSSAREILVISSHAREDATDDSGRTSDGIYTRGMLTLGSWCIQSPQNTTYRSALDQAIRSQPSPDLRRENRGRLIEVLLGLDWSLSEAGRRRLGIKSSEHADTVDEFRAVFLSQSKARVEIVKAERSYWAALSLPAPQLTGALSRATERQNDAVRAFPWLVRHFEPETRGDVNAYRQYYWDIHQLEFKGLLRAVSNRQIARAIRTNDLKSPFDGPPMTYRFDGKQMDFGFILPTSRGQLHVKVPPDDPVKPKY